MLSTCSAVLDFVEKLNKEGACSEQQEEQEGLPSLYYLTVRSLLNLFLSI